VTDRFRCCECGGQVHPVAGVGRTRSLEYGKPLPVPDDFLIPTCAKCGETYMDPDRAEVLDAFLAAAVKPTTTKPIPPHVTVLGFDPASSEDVAVTFGMHVGGTIHWHDVITPTNIDEKAAEAGVTREPGEEWADWAVRIGERLAERREAKT
jgi:hypothetical protein